MDKSILKPQHADFPVICDKYLNINLQKEKQTLEWGFV